MAFTWLEKNQTKVTSNQWGEDIYGLKATNVFGLAWNYYLGYTKFITGLDMTLDMGLKAEFFYANTYKIGYASETNFNNATKVQANQRVTNFHTSVSSAYGSVQSVISEALAQITTRTENVEEDNRVAGQANINYGERYEEGDDLVITIASLFEETSEERTITAASVTLDAEETNITGFVNLGSP